MDEQSMSMEWNECKKLIIDKLDAHGKDIKNLTTELHELQVNLAVVEEKQKTAAMKIAGITAAAVSALSGAVTWALGHVD